MRKWIVGYILLTCRMFAFGQTNDKPLHIRDYITQYLVNSATVDTAVKNANVALETLQDAKAGQASAYDLGLLENEYRFKQSEILASENAAVKLAFQQVFAVFGNATSVEQAKTAEEIARVEYERAEELLEKEYISVRDKRIVHKAFVQAQSSTRDALSTYAVAQKVLSRAIGGGSVKVEPFETGVAIPDIEGIEWIVEHDAQVQKLKVDLSLYVERRKFLITSDATYPALLDALSEAIEEAEQALRDRIWYLDDSLAELFAQIESNNDEKVIAELDEEIKTMDLQEARHQFERGNIYASDVTQAELAHASVTAQLSSIKRNRFLLILDALSLLNVSLMSWVEEHWSE